MLNFDDYIKTLTKLISFKSVYSSPTPDAPFGEENKNALQFFLKTALDMGFETINYDNYAGEVIFGQGEEIGIIGHLDVVPVGSNWQTDPFTLTKIDGKYFARGISDDKGPMLACLFALKELKDSGKAPKRKIRLFVGCDEESGWRDVEYLKTKTTLPEYGFSPDGNFPLSYAEKGMFEVEFTLPKLNGFYGVKGGTVVNAVCDYAIAIAKEGYVDVSLLKKHGLNLKNGNVIESFGKSAHGSTPHLGKNAIKPLLEYMRDMGENLGDVIDNLFNDKQGVSKMQNEQGFVTFSPDLICEKDGLVKITCDCRVPAPFSFNDVMEKIDKFNLEVKTHARHQPLLVGKDGWFIRTLISAYNTVTNENAKPISMGGSTFARAFEKGCAFGCAFPSYDNKIHDAGEHETEQHLLTAYEIYKTAIFALCL